MYVKPQKNTRHNLITFYIFDGRFKYIVRLTTHGAGIVSAPVDVCSLPAPSDDPAKYSALGDFLMNFDLSVTYVSLWLSFGIDNEYKRENGDETLSTFVC